jgi:hypothetical protein
MENPDNEELIAYLDGELDPRTSQQVEERLKHDPAYRQALTLYERSWDMLDQLERATVGENFSRTTLEMVSLAAAEEQQPSPALGRIDLRRAGIVGLTAVVALVLGYAGGRAIWPDPNQQLLQDLPILEEFDLYELYAEGGSLEFLHKLENSGLFKHAPGHAKTPGLAIPEALADRQAELARMSAAEREQLARKLDRFMEYSPQEQQRLRELHESLNRGSEGATLHDVLVSYHEWLDVIPSGVREKLNGLSDDERIAQIAHLKQVGNRGDELRGATAQDLPKINEWLDDFAWQHREALLATLSDRRRKVLEGLEDSQQHLALRWIMQHRGSGYPLASNVFPTSADFARLAERLSPSARARLDAASDEVDKQKLIHQWGQLGQQQVRMTVGLPGVLPPISVQELQRFAREELTKEQRAAFLPMARQRMYRQLQALYLLSADRVAEMTPEQISNGIPLMGTQPPHRLPSGSSTSVPEPGR